MFSAPLTTLMYSILSPTCRKHSMAQHGSQHAVSYQPTDTTMHCIPRCKGRYCWQTHKLSSCKVC
jgi:hypothetical protein